MSFVRDPARRPISVGGALTLVAAFLRVISCGLSSIGLLLIGGLLVAGPSSAMSSDELALVALAGAMAVGMVALDGLTAAALAVLGLRGLRGEGVGALQVLLVLLACFDAVRAVTTLLGGGCLSCPLYVGLALTQGLAAFTVSWERGGPGPIGP